MIPVRRDILVKQDLGFDAPWKKEVFSVSLKQIRLNKKNRLPYSNTLDILEQSIYKIWAEVISASVDGCLSHKQIRAIQASVE